MAAPAAPLCVYHGVPILAAELLHEGFCEPPSRFTYNRKTFFKMCGDQFFMSGDDRPLFPDSYFKGNAAKFIQFASDPANLQPIDAIGAMTAIAQSGPIECAELAKSNDFNIFCSDSVESKLRMKMFCAFGKLHCFLNKAKIKLLVRGGMALRMQLRNKTQSQFVQMAPFSDIDGVVIVDRSVSPVDFEQFKETFMKLLVSSIPQNVSLICSTATGDENTVKVKCKAFGGIYEMIDVSFKYSDDPVVGLYRGTFHKYVQVYPYMLPCVWNFPSRNHLREEYEYVLANLHKTLSEMPVAEAGPTPEQSKLLQSIEKFSMKLHMASTGVGLGGGKKRTMKRRNRGGSTTEQIGAAAQMRAFLPRHSATRNALNHIVHHESKNRFHDANYRHSPKTQAVINRAYRAINANPNISQRTKKHMKIAKHKAFTHRR